MSAPILLHPSFSPAYYAFYIEGLQRLFPGRRVVVTRDGMPPATQYDDGCALIVPGARNERIYLSANDHDRIDRVALRWCDRYGMVNVNPRVIADDSASASDSASVAYNRVRPIGPGFGIRPETSLSSTTKLLAAAALARLPDLRGAAVSARAVKTLWTRRVRESAYVPGQSASDHVFFAAWAWKKHAEVNPPRARFMRVCQRTPGLVFEGGFAPRRTRDLRELDDVTAPRLYPLPEYVARIRRSAFVFNNPAVHACLGWKLGEFLALGKAIISLPLSREMPAPLRHGEHVHVVNDDEESIADGIARLRADPAYRATLERNARRYYEQYLAPQAVMGRLLYDDGGPRDRSSRAQGADS